MKKTGIILISLCCFSCLKDEEKRTYEDDSLSFYLNGKLWQSSRNQGGGGLFGSADGCSIYYNTYYDYFELKAYSDYDNQPSISILLPNPSVSDSTFFEFETNPTNAGIFYGDCETNYIHLRYILGYKNTKLYLGKLNSGNLKFTRMEESHDESGLPIRHYEGVFNATLYNIDDPNDAVVIKDGYFNN